MKFDNSDIGDRNEDNENNIEDENGFNNLCTCGCGQFSQKKI